MPIIKLLRKIKTVILPSRRYKEYLKGEALKMEQRKKFYSDILKINSLCFDVGANFGNRVEPLLATGAKVIAIEPQQKCVQYLKKTFGNKIVVIQKGIGANTELKEFFIADAHTLSTFSKDWMESVKVSRFNNNKWKSEKLVEMTTLDNLINEFGVPSFIKIDVEGYEVEVLKGLSTPIDLICYEYTVPEQTHKAINCIELMNKLGPVECNYTVGDNITFQLIQWISSEDMINHIQSDVFIKTSCGDIYIKKIT